MLFKLKAKFHPAGDQPKAIAALINGLKKGLRHQTLLGVTGSGKTFTMANVIAKVGKPTLVIAHNKTLAAQLAQEYQDFFPGNAVHYFVSYYDYYRPESYLPVTDTYIEKEAKINAEIDRLRHSATAALLTRRDVIIVASVSCIYGLGSPAEYQAGLLRLKVGDPYSRRDLLRDLISIHYERTNADLVPGSFRVIGDSVEIMAASGGVIENIILAAGRIRDIVTLDAVSRRILAERQELTLFPAKHFLLAENRKKCVIDAIRRELKERLRVLTDQGELLAAERLKRRTNYDLALIEEIGYCPGIENYSRHFSGRRPGEPPDTLLSYFPSDFLTIIDESHVTVPQLSGMYAGDRSRKQTLIDYGFRLPSALDNRPLKFSEFTKAVGPVIYTSATPGEYERNVSVQIVRQIIRPTGLVDPLVEIRPVKEQKRFLGQVHDFIGEIEQEVKAGGRIIATTLTKKMAEDLSDYLKSRGIKAEYLHSGIKTLARIEILSDFRRGKFDCLVGVNLLREGLDLPEVALIGILDADKEGFLRSETSLIQIIGRAARNVRGRVILYADTLTASLRRAIDETNRRRQLQLEYNRQHRITPRTISKQIKDITAGIESERAQVVLELLKIDRQSGLNVRTLIKDKSRQMSAAVKNLDFETAAILRDEIRVLEKKSK